ncbi:MAG: lysylphosphatidylglycerol synthase transmembrane domain-containing protein [Chloroflexota bacterium]
MTSPESVQPSTQRPFWRSPRSLLYAIALLFLAIVLWRSKFWESGDAIGNIDALDLVLVPLLSLALLVPLALRQRAILGALGYRFSARSLAPISYYGNTVGFMTPAASGEVLRPSLFRRTFGVPTAQGVGIVLFERLFSFYLLGLSCLLALSWTGAAPGWVGPVALPMMIAACLAPSAFVALAPTLNNRLPARRLGNLVPHRIRDRIGEQVKESGSTLSRLWLNATVVAFFIALSAITFLVMAIQFWLIPEALGQDISLQEAWVVLTAGAMAGFLSGLPLGLGATDAVMLSLLKAYGVETTEAGQIVILTRVLINLPGGLFGLAAYLLAVRQKPAGTPATPVARFAAASLGRDTE